MYCSFQTVYGTKCKKDSFIMKTQTFTFIVIIFTFIIVYTLTGVQIHQFDFTLTTLKNLFVPNSQSAFNKFCLKKKSNKFRACCLLGCCNDFGLKTELFLIKKMNMLSRQDA